MITKYNQFNEGIKHLLVGPTNDEIWNNLKKLSPYMIMKKSSEIGLLKGIKLALDRGVNIHVNDDEPLRYSAENGHLDIVKYLVENGCNIHIRDDEPLRYAAEYGHLDVVKYLIENGAIINISNNYPLRYSSYFGHLDIVKYLVENGCNINNEILKFSLERGHLDVYNYLKSKIENTNEGIKHLLVGPSEKEVWNSYEGNIFFDIPPPTLKDFLDKLINLLDISGDINSDFYTKYDRNDRFFIVFKIKNNQLFYLQYNVLELILYYYLNDDKEYDYYIKTYSRMNKKTLMYYVLRDYFTNKYDRQLDVNIKIINDIK